MSTTDTKDEGPSNLERLEASLRLALASTEVSFSLTGSEDTADVAPSDTKSAPSDSAPASALSPKVVERQPDVYDDWVIDEDTKFADDTDWKDYAESVEEPTGPPVLMRQTSYLILGSVELSERQRSMIDDVINRLGASTSDAYKFLRAFQWSTDELMADWTKDRQGCCEHAKVDFTKYAEITTAKLSRSEPADGVVVSDLDPNHDDPTVQDGKSIATDDSKPADQGAPAEELLYECPLCMDDFPYDETYALDCEHRFCMTCWKHWVSAQFEERGQMCVFTECMLAECNHLIPTEFFIEATDDPNRKKKVAEWVNDAFVKSNQFVKWCPAAGCSRAVEYGKNRARTVNCVCGHSFCFACSADAHEPAPCDAVRKWNRLNSTDAGIFDWIKANKGVKEIKNCTKCHVVIEKNQGCKHMTCKNCGHEFCWLCFQDWRGHKSELCIDHDKKEKERDSSEWKGDEKSNEFRRYQFFWSRFDNQKRAIEYAEKALAVVDDKVAELQRLVGLDLAAAEYIIDAIRAVIKGRQVVMWCYPWQFYMKKTDSHAQFIRVMLAMLEDVVEELSEAIEYPVEKLALSETRSRVRNLVRLTNLSVRGVTEYARLNTS